MKRSLLLQRLKLQFIEIVSYKLSYKILNLLEKIVKPIRSSVSPTGQTLYIENIAARNRKSNLHSYPLSRIDMNKGKDNISKSVSDNEIIYAQIISLGQPQLNNHVKLFIAVLHSACIMISELCVDTIFPRYNFYACNLIKFESELHNDLTVNS